MHCYRTRGLGLRLYAFIHTTGCYVTWAAIVSLWVTGISICLALLVVSAHLRSARKASTANFTLSLRPNRTGVSSGWFMLDSANTVLDTLKISHLRSLILSRSHLKELQMMPFPFQLHGAFKSALFTGKETGMERMCAGPVPMEQTLHSTAAQRSFWNFTRLSLRGVALSLAEMKICKPYGISNACDFSSH